MAVERCALYCRLSFTADGSIEAVTRQEEASRQLAQRLGWPVAEVYVDNNLSAWKRGVVRPSWNRMLADLASGARDAIITYHGDRLMRRGRDLEDLLDLADQRQLSIASVSGTRDLSNPDDRYILRIEVAAAIRESDNISRRVQAAVTSNASKGKPQPSRVRGYGYERDCVTICETEAALIRDMAARVLSGQSVLSIARWLNDMNVPTVTGAAWIPSTVRSILTHPRIVGLRTLKGQVVGPGIWEPILDRETWEDVRTVISPVQRNTGRPAAARTHLLTGIAKCGSCGAGLRSMRRPDRKHLKVYLCDNRACPGPKVVRSEELLDDWVTEVAVAQLSRPEAVRERAAFRSAPKVTGQITALEKRMAADQARFRTIEDADHFDPELAMQRIAGYRKRIAELREQMAVSARQRLITRHAGITREQFEAWSLDEQRAVIAALMTVTVLPSRKRGPGFDRDCVRLTPVTE